MAGRLALQLGIDDPEQWLESQPDRVIDYWEAFDRRRPIGVEWERHASLMSLLELVLVTLINVNRAKDSKPTKAQGYDAFLPEQLKAKSNRKRVSLKRQLQIFAKAYGGNYGDND